MQISKQGVFQVPNVLGHNLIKIVLANHQMYVEIINIGATVFGIYLPAKNGAYDNVVLNYPEVSDYLTDDSYIGCTVGRVAGRIQSGRLPVNGQLFQLPKNESGRHHLHGGVKGFNKKIFEVADFEHSEDISTVTLYTESPDGEEGYPGKLKVWVTYTLQQDNTLAVRYKAVSDQPTHVNLTNHSYFNLSGRAVSALDQQLQISAHEILDIDDFFIPTGKKLPVRHTGYDFEAPLSIREQKAKLPRTYFNDCYLLDKTGKPDAILSDPENGRRMEMSTTYPSILFYTGDYLKRPFAPCEGICLEAQFVPDAPNQDVDYTTSLNAGDEYLQEISLNFSW